MNVFPVPAGPEQNVIQLSFIAEVGPMMHPSDKLPNLLAFRDRCHQREAYQSSLAKTEPYAYGPK